MAPDVEHRLAAILSADAVGYSRLMAGDEAATVRAITAYRDEIQRLVEEHGGRVVDSPGDNLLAEFPTATGAVRCALEIHRTIAERNAGLGPDRRLEFRIGVHLGEVRVEGGRIYGDGVNIAARLEGLADPGTVCVSAEVRRQLRGKMEASFEDLGDQALKNIPEPVHAYRLGAALSESAEHAEGTFTVPGFSDRPAIAVLPFDNLSGDLEQEYFADGIAEDLITRLAAGRLFPVIARNSSFVYKGRAVDVKQVSRELGVRYVVEGSVRRAGDRVRITAQVIDATTGHHVWAERHDRELKDVFTLQDEITDAILGSLEPALRRVEERRAMQKAPASLDAWECCQRATWHMDQTEPEWESTVSWCQRALELDPQCTMALGLLAYAHCIAAIYQAPGSQDEALRLATESAERAVALDGDNPNALTALGMALWLRGDYDRAHAVASRALEINPSHSPAYAVLGNVLTVSNRPDDAIATIEKGLRLSPNDPMTWSFWFAIGLAHFVAGRSEEAVESVRRSLYYRKNPGTYRLLAAVCGHLGRIEEGRAALAELVRMTPGFSVDAFRAYFPPEIIGRYLEGWRELGWEG